MPSMVINQLAIYEQMAALSARMVTAAANKDWSALLSLEREIARVGALLAADDSELGSSPDSARKTALIQRILRDDAEIRRHTEPWMERLGRYLEHPISPSAALAGSRVAAP